MHRIGRSLDSHQRFRRSVQLAALEDVLPDCEIDRICHAHGHTWRDRELTPAVTVRSMVYRGLSPDRSIAATLADLAAGWAEQKEAPDN